MHRLIQTLMLAVGILLVSLPIATAWNEQKLASHVGILCNDEEVAASLASHLHFGNEERMWMLFAAHRGRAMSTSAPHFAYARRPWCGRVRLFGAVFRETELLGVLQVERVLLMQVSHEYEDPPTYETEPVLLHVRQGKGGYFLYTKDPIAVFGKHNPETFEAIDPEPADVEIKTILQDALDKAREWQREEGKSK